MPDQKKNIEQMHHNPFMQHNHIHIGLVSADYAEVFLDIQPSSTNLYGFVHGGALFTMADCCAGLAVRSDGRQYVTQNSSVNFIRNVKCGRITAKGRVVSRGRHICVSSVDIYSDTDVLLLNSTFSMYCTG